MTSPAPNTTHALGHYSHQAQLATLMGIRPTERDPRRRAEALIAEAHEKAEPYAAERGKYPFIAGWLRSTVSDLCLEVAQLRGDTLRPQDGTELLTLTLGDADVVVEFEVSGPSGDGWNEPHAEREITILGAFVNGQWIDTEDTISEKVTRRWLDQIAEFLDARNDSDRQEAAEAARDWSAA